MTITFRCPHCGNLCAFDEEHIGKRARCMNCSERFIIPSEESQKAKKAAEEIGEPSGGYYRAIFVDSWGMFFRRQNITTLVFIVAVVSFKFFIGHINPSFVAPGLAINIPVDWIVMFVCWGYLFWLYMAVIESTVLDSDDLPDIDVGAGFSFFGTLFKSIYLFIVAIILAQLPFLIVRSILESYLGINWVFLRHACVLAGLFFAPMSLLTISSAKESWMVLRPDYIFVPVFKAFGPYLVCAVLMGVAGLLQLMTIEYGRLEDASRWVIAGNLLLNILAVLVAIVAMRSVGLFFRHYECYFPWK